MGYYPGALPETGYDILFFWVARMVMMGLELTGKLPFTDVFLHTLVRDKNGRKMSKSLGNVLDPLWVVYGASLEELHNSLKGGNLPPAEVERATQLQTDDFPNGIAPCGSDGLRYALLFNTQAGSDTNLDINVVVKFQQFAQKVWQATSGIVLPYLKGYTPKAQPMQGVDAPLVCKWAITQLDIAVEKVNTYLSEYQFSDSARIPFKFFTDDFCGTFIEHIKAMGIRDMKDGPLKEAVQETIYTLLDTQLRLLHPFMPFITEELWQRLPKRASETSKTIMLAAYPLPQASWRDVQADADFEVVRSVVDKFRTMKATAGLKPKELPPAFYKSDDTAVCTLLESQKAGINAMVGVDLNGLAAGARAPAGPSMVVGSVTICLDIAGLVDMGAELKKLETQLQQKEAQVKKITDEQANPNYMKKPEAKRAKDDVKKAGLETEVAQLKKAVQEMQGSAGGDSSSFNMWYANKCQ